MPDKIQLKSRWCLPEQCEPSLPLQSQILGTSPVWKNVGVVIFGGRKSYWEFAEQNAAQALKQYGAQFSSVDTLSQGLFVYPILSHTGDVILGGSAELSPSYLNQV